MSTPLNWDNVRIFLATLRTTSLSKAAADLGVSRPTARRRLGDFEEGLGLRLFDRRPDGLHVTPHGAEVAKAAEEVERSMLALTRVAQATDPALRGPIKVTLPGALASDLLMADFAEFAERWPHIDLRFDASYDIENLGVGQADVAIRFKPHGQLPADHLAGRLAAVGHTALYGSGDNWIGLQGGEEDAGWVRGSAFPELPVRGAMFDLAMLRSACAAGMGIARLPCFYAEPMLTRRSEPEPGIDIWVLVHPDLRRNPRLRVFRDAVVAALQRHGPRLKGRVAG